MISIITGSCSGRKNKLDSKNLIPEKELVSLLTDIHIADGLLILPNINSWTSSLDSISTYCQVIEKHGYTKEIMDRTMKYYFLKNPKKLNKIYDQVLGILSEMEARYDKEFGKEQTHYSNSWRGREFYSIPSVSGNDSTGFDINLTKSGFYTLTFTATLFPDDESINASATAYLSSPDSIDTGKRHYFKSSNYIKDGRSHNYSLTLPVPENTIRHLRGWFYDFENCSSGPEKHINIDNISLKYSAVAI
jgi:hypothetical protein